MEAGPSPGTGSEPRQAYCVLAYEKEACPPTVSAAGEDYYINPHGLATEVSITGESEIFLGGGFAETQTIVAGKLHPVPISVKGDAQLCQGPFKWQAVVANFGGTVVGPTTKDTGVGECH